jgi:hypothetical protein
MSRVRFRRPATPVLVSIALHVVLGAGLLHVLLVPGSVRWTLTHALPPKPERVDLVMLPQRGEASPGRDGGDDRPPTKAPRPATPLVAPTVVSSALPPVVATPNADAGGSGPRIGAGGPTAGIRPSFSDPRVWAPPGDVVVLPPTGVAQLDRTLKGDIQRHNDSLATYTHVPSKLERGDWTVGGPGGKWGVEPGKIRLGKFSLPSAVLALLPLNMQGGNRAAGGQDLVQQRAMDAIRRDIQFQSQRMLNEEELRVAAKRIRERVDRERREKAAKEQQLQPQPSAPLQP